MGTNIISLVLVSSLYSPANNWKIIKEFNTREECHSVVIEMNKNNNGNYYECFVPINVASGK